jgi:hypothetical protein
MGRVSAISKVSPSRFRSATQAGNLLGGSLLGGSLLLGTVTGQRNDATSGFWVWAGLGVTLNPTNTGSRNNRDYVDSMRTPNPSEVGTLCWPTSVRNITIQADRFPFAVVNCDYTH